MSGGVITFMTSDDIDKREGGDHAETQVGMTQLF